MALNKVDVSNGRLTLHGDYVVHHQDNIEFSLEGDRLRSDMKGKFKGDMFITNMKLIFSNKESNGYRSFSMDFQHIRNTEIKQPIFGCNYLKGFIIAEPNGGWEGNANFNVMFPKGGAIEFAETFQRTVKQSLRNRQAGVTPMPPMQPTGYFPPPQMGYAPQPGYAQPGYPPQAGYMGMPPQGMPPQGMPPQGYYPPPQESLYVYQGQASGPPQGQSSYTPQPGQAPPPYDPNGAPQHISTPAQQSSNPKAHEAYMSGNTAYVPNIGDRQGVSEDSEAPPPYNPTYDPKKNQ